MPNWISIEKNDALLRLFIVDISIKLLVSPWATGDYIAAWGTAVSYATDGILLGIVFVQLRRFPKSHLVIFAVFVATALSYALSTFIFTDESMVGALINHLKLYLPFLAVPTAISLATHSRVSVERAAYFMILMIIVLIIIGLATFPPSKNRTELWLPTYFGGLHTSAYVGLMTMFCFHALASYKRLSWFKAVPPMLLLIALITVGWGVRTASIGVVLFFVGQLISRFLFKNRPVMAVFFPLGIAIPAGIFPTLDFAGDINDASSGRIEMYIAKYDQLMANDFLNWIIGNGYLSDLILTDVWWWAPKGAHSDLITFLVEGGLIYFFGFLVVLYQFIKHHNSLPERLIIVAIISTSIFSNGVFARPIAAYLLSIVFVIHYVNKQRLKQENGV